MIYIGLLKILHLIFYFLKVGLACFSLLNQCDQGSLLLKEQLIQPYAFLFG